jgi:flavin reductase (DIM6/NTAB) family NADH-FMN oxidoreductase RutF
MMDVTAVATLFACLDRELWLVTAQDGGRRGGCIATFVNQASIVPELPRMVIGLARQHHTWELIEASNAFGLHLLGEGRLEWVWRFGLDTGRGRDKLEGLRLEPTATAAPLLADALGWLDCRVEARLDTGDRTLYLAEVVAARVSQFEPPPLTLRRLLQLSPPELARELKRRLHQDSILDAEAIRAWRELQARE